MTLIMLPFSTAEYRDAVSGQCLRFSTETQGSGMVWTGKGWEKTGTWKRSFHSGKELLEVSYNFAREAAFVLPVMSESGGVVTAFRLEDGKGERWEFRV